MSEYIFFYLGLTFIIIHEMDAIRCKEWRIFPGLELLNDKWGFRVFMLAHLPIFYFLIIALTKKSLDSDLIFGLDLFFIIHLGLHLLFLLHKKNEFKDATSWIIISTAGLFGALDLLIRAT